jgi:hypothetical protein
VAAQTIGVAHVGVVEDLPGFVRRVTLHADRDDAFLLPKFAADHFTVDLFDQPVALHTGPDYVVLVDRRPRVRVGEYVVTCVATGADGCHHQALLEQTLTVDALLVPLDDLLLRDVVGALDLGPFRVTLSTHLGSVER